ncbi:hypothetical protein RM780_26105 [Streptomyces sp. DSM 44917]|uniref:Uncharacterized protein n=1 Tax=Streptomyces boetiae TaxID=3075541 RepID=A0ABU2LG12_9ACTN|nr:hypothetical protein [Streptomyces sp. DSM 44917]MDT0310395.1 hypothetical protein [Streptomyces sp. DSM 44917]
MSPLLDVSDDVRAEIGDEEADRLLAGENAPGSYDCTSCRTPGNPAQERTSTVLFVGGETAVLAFAHASCIPSQVVAVSEEQLQGAVRSITGGAAPVPPQGGAGVHPEPGQAVLGVTCGQILIDNELHPAIVVEPTGPIVRPGTNGPGDDFLPLLIEAGFLPVTNVARQPSMLPGWSVLVAMGQLHAVLQADPSGGQPSAWWQAHQPLPLTEGWRASANQRHTVFVYAAPAGSIGQQPREDLLRDALEKAAAGGLLVAAAMPLTGT